MIVANVEYLGFKCLEIAREYRLRVHCGPNLLGEVTVAIPNSVFLARIVRYQDGPDLCFHKLQVMVAASTDLPERIDITPADLADYCTLRAPRAATRRAPRPRPVES
jgi:hypothetical protein